MAKQHIEDYLMIENHHLIEKMIHTILNSFFLSLDIIVDKSIQTIVHKLFQKIVPYIVQ